MVFGAQSGDVVGPVRTDEGWHLIKVEAVRHAMLDDATREHLKSLLFREWLTEQRGKAQITMPILEASADEEEGEGDEE